MTHADSSEPLEAPSDAIGPDGASESTSLASTQSPEEATEPERATRPPSRRRRGGRRRGRATAGDPEEAAEDRDSAASEGPSERDDDAPPPRKARRRAKPKRRASAEPDDDSSSGDAPRAEDEAPRKKRRRGSRGGRRRRKGAAQEQEALGIEAIPGEDDDLALEDAAAGDGHRAVVTPDHRSKDKRHDRSEDEGTTRRGPGRRRKAGRSKQDAEDERADEEASSGGRRRRGRKARTKTAREADELEPRKEPEVVRDQRILVNAVDPEETRVVVVQDGKIVDLQMTVERHKSYVNDIYRGRVVNLESAIGAAFVDFGQGRNGFLHQSDVMDFYGAEEFSLERLLTARTETEDWESKGVQPEELENGPEEEGGEEGAKAKVSKGKKKTAKRAAKKRGKKTSKRSSSRRRQPITDLLQKGQLVVAQITKDAIGDKGPTLTTYISIPGRYLVLMPSLERTGVSRKIEDERERRRLKRILQGLDIPNGMGVIVRTAGVGKTKAEIKRDLDYLLAVWEQFTKDLVLGRSPAPLYQESDVAIRTMRDLFSSRTEEVVVDDQKVFEQMVKFTEKLMPEHVDRIRLHDGARPLFHTFGVEQDFERLFVRRVELPSGGSIVIDQTEALVAIDVNSGRTRDDGADFEDIALKTNLEAVPEIARQIKLRDMGGIVVLDFIDMLRPAARRQVEKALRERLAEDRARSKIGRISQFGLLELTRQRLGPGLSKLIFDSCSACRGTGRRRTAQSRAQALLRRLGSALTQKGFTKIEILTHQDTIDWVHKHDRTQLEELRTKHKRELVFKTVEDQLEDSVFHYLRADGREVRPGGRRKR